MHAMPEIDAIDLTPSPPDPDLVYDLAALIGAKVEQTLRLIPPVDRRPMAEPVHTWAISWLTQANTSEHEAEAVCHTLMGTLFEAGAVPPREFWTRPFGAYVADTIGYHRADVPMTVASHILGFTRQRIYQLVKDGRLTAGTGSMSTTADAPVTASPVTVSAASVRALYRERTR